MRSLVPIARLLFVALFLMSAPGHFQAQTIAYAAQQGVPFASVLVPLSGLLAIAGGLSVLLGWHARVGAWLLVAFLVPVTLAMHAFWNVPDPMTRMMQQAMFMKNLAMLGGALLVAYWGAGPVSLDERAERSVPEATSATAILSEALHTEPLPARRQAS
jgi:putative oxidoreductase